VLPVIGVLHNGKSMMRDKYWEGNAPSPTITELPAYYSEWIGYGLQTLRGTDRPAAKPPRSSIAPRFSTYSVWSFPSPLKHFLTLGAKPMRLCPGQFIPSFFWKE
jgi:hypothetical protein